MRHERTPLRRASLIQRVLGEPIAQTQIFSALAALVPMLKRFFGLMPALGKAMLGVCQRPVDCVRRFHHGMNFFLYILND